MGHAYDESNTVRFTRVERGRTIHGRHCLTCRRANAQASRRNRGALPKGHLVVKLNESQVREILAVPNGYGVARRLAAKYGVHGATVSAIFAGRIWKRIPRDTPGPNEVL